MMQLIPVPKKINGRDEKTDLTVPVSLQLPKELSGLDITVQDLCFHVFEQTGDSLSQVEFSYRPQLSVQAYEVEVEKDKAVIGYSHEQGARYGLITLSQILMSPSEILCCSIWDEPDIPHRGFMMDISRGKVPTVATCKRLIRLLGMMQYNQLQLYIEGFSFYYPSFSQYCDRNASLTGEELEEINQYAMACGIELVPNQNSLGHMAPWLAKPEFASLAECEGGFQTQGVTLPPTTLDPSNQGSMQLIARMMDDLLIHFTSNQFHGGLDEPFELGQGKSKGKDLGKLFLHYLNQLNAQSKMRGRELMVWADSVHKYMAKESQLPKDVIYLEWGYEKEHPFQQRCSELRDKGCRFYVCPGTNSWLSFTGMTDNMMENIDQAIDAGCSCKAEGILLTDWGDCNHMQYLPISYPAIVYCGAGSWNSSHRLSETMLAQALNELVYQDQSSCMGQIALAAGNYYQLEEFQMPCKTIAHSFYAGGIKSMEEFQPQIAFLKVVMKLLTPKEVYEAYPMEPIREESEAVNQVLALLHTLEQKLKNTRMECEDASLIQEEYENAFHMVEYYTRCRRTTEAGAGKIEEIIQQHQKLWRMRNKESGLQQGIQQLLLSTQGDDK